MSQLRQFRLPDVGEGLTEADIVRWHVKPGDPVTENQIIVEIETAKAVVELPSPYAGTVAELLVPEGATADVGTPIISVEVESAEAAGAADGAGPAEPATAPASGGAARQGRKDRVRRARPADELVPEPPAEGAVEPGLHGSPAPKEERQAVLVGYGVKLGATKRRPRKQAAAPATSGRPAAQAAPATSGRPAAMAGAGANALAGTGARALAKPPVRKLARDLGVDLAGLTGTGPQGSITRDDVRAAAEPAGMPAAAGLAPAVAPARWAGLAAVAREERVPIRGVRKHTAAAVTASAFTAPHVTEFLQIDATETMAATERLRALPEFEGIRVSPLLLVARALLTAVARHPMINSTWDEAAREIVVRHYVNLGIAAATDRGLVVPNIKDAHALSLPDLARALHQLAETARAGQASPADLTGGTITITNVGVFGVDAGTPILTPGEAAILAFGQVRDLPWVHGGQVAVRKVTTLALSFDHRIVDGDLGSAVLRDVGAMLEDPLRMLAWS
jgi:2-oxoisovalerate dehydrogenase E2 component (dihydrolipoyl transacylase)